MVSSSAHADKVVRPLKYLKKSIGNLDGDFASKLISSAMDVALVIDRAGVVQDYSVGDDELSREKVFTSLVGRPWVDSVTLESRVKVEEMLRDAGTKAPPRWRQVNHPSSEGSDLPIRYSALAFGNSGRILAVGRELRSVSALQQRLVNVQQSMEREYSRLRLAETRYRLLFQTASEAVIIADAQTLKIVEINPAAEKLLGKPARRKSSKTLADIVEAEFAPALRKLFEQIRATGNTDEVRVKLEGSERDVLVSGSLFRQDQASHVLIRLAPADAGGKDRDAGQAAASLKHVVEGMPDGFVVLGSDRRIQTANSAFLELAQLPAEERARGELVERWLGRSDVELNTLFVSAVEHGATRHFRTIIRGDYGATEDVEVSAVHVADRKAPCFGLSIRPVGKRAPALPGSDRDLPRSVQQMTGLVGQVPLKNLVRETTDLIERLCIEAALELVGDNRASAAEMLGLSRQSLYIKLRRYGLGDLGVDN